MNDTAPTPLRIFLIEDSTILRMMLRDMLSELDGVEVVGDADDESGALAGLERRCADLAIVDIELRAGSGLGVLTRLRAEPERYGPLRVAVLTNHGHRAIRARCAALGVEQVFDKSFQMDELIDFIEAAVRAL